MCDLTAGRAKVCKKQIGGNSNVFLINSIDNPFTLTDGLITGINAGITAAYKYELIGDNNTFSQVKSSDRTAGTSINTQTLVMSLNALDSATSIEMNNIAHGYPIAVVNDRNGNYFAVGIDDGIDFQIATTTAGAKSDFNGYTLTGTSTTRDLAPHLDAATVTALLALVA